MARFDNKTVWITGASSGIGAALAQEFANEGSHIILSGRRVDALEAVGADLPNPSLILPFETTDYAVLPEKSEAAWDWRGRVDILVNNAGISQRSLAVDTDTTVYRDIIDIDLLAPIWLTQLQLPKMVAAGGANIVAISSVAGRVGVPLRTAYCAAKHGLIGYMDSLRAETSLAHNIHVTNVLPGSVNTDVARNALNADGSVRGRSDAAIDSGDDPADCAKAILEAVAVNQPELIFAKGLEADICEWRQKKPDQLFENLAQLGSRLAARREAGSEG